MSERQAVGVHYRQGARATLDLAGHISTDEYLEMIERASAPATPGSGYSRAYADSYGIPFFKNDAGDSSPMMQSVIPIPLMAVYNVNNSWTTVNGRRALYLPDAVAYTFEVQFPVPPGWTLKGSSGIEMVLWGAQTSAGTGNVFIWHDWYLWNPGSTPSGGFGASSNTVAMPNVVGRIVQFKRPITNDTAAEGDAITWRFSRWGAHGNDTASCGFAIVALGVAISGFYP